MHQGSGSPNQHDAGSGQHANMDEMLTDALCSYRALPEDVRDEMPFSQYVSFKREYAGSHYKNNAAKDVKDKISVHKFKGGGVAHEAGRLFPLLS